MGTGFRRKAGTKTPPYFSHEFVIQNHGDIATCMCMIFIVGLMFQVTTPIASVFIAPKYNVTELDAPIVNYTYGYKDICLVSFYTVVSIIFHAIIQEYLLDKLMRKVRLSKTKANKFNESGQMLAFYLISIVWAIFLFREENYFQSLSFFWTDYPHNGITFLTKFFFIVQMSYWVHIYPELYFQKVKKEDMSQKVILATIQLVICAAIYVLNLTRIGITLLFIDYVTNAIFHLSRLLHFSGLNKVSRISFNVYNILFVLARFTSAILAIFVFWFGLKSSSQDKINFETRNFNTPLVRHICLAVALFVQVFALYQFIIFQIKKLRENSKSSKSKSSSSTATQKKQKVIKEEGSDSEVDRRELRNSHKNGDSINKKSN
jgi:translocating chain-associated membrane protein 1